jgi:UDP-N-acetylglucosamine transferase subunit ALG13
METLIEFLQKSYLWRSDILIFVTVGTPTNSFERLIKELDNLVSTEKIKDNVLAQIGYTKYIPKNYKWFRFTDPDKFENLCKKSKICITHGGVGTLSILLKYKKPTIVVPRMKKFNEHVDDHQIQIIKELEKEGRIIAVYDIKKLENALIKANKWKPNYLKRKSKIFDLIKNFLNDMK